MLVDPAGRATLRSMSRQPSGPHTRRWTSGSLLPHRHNWRVFGNFRATVVGMGQAGLRHALALRDLGVSVTGPLSGTAIAADPAALSDPSIDVVHVCAANDLHVPLVSAALNAGKHVVCEKPLALDAAQAEILATLARRSGRLAVLCHNYRFHPLVVELAARVAAGELGMVHAVRGSYLQDWLLLEADVDWRLDPGRGGASRTIADIGTHWIDLAEMIGGQHLAAVSAQVGQLHQRPTEDHAGLLLRFAGGIQGTCVVSQAAAGHRGDMELSLDGSAGSATWRRERPDELWLGTRARGLTRITREGHLISDAARALAALPGGPNESRTNLFAAVYATISEDERAPTAPLPTFDDGVRHLRFVAAALESARRDTWATVR